MPNRTIPYRTGGVLIFVAISLVLAPGSIAELSNVSVGENWALYPDHHRCALLYVYGGVPFKPYVKELYTPGGVNILRDSPTDHKHHHGLMFAVAADGVNFWEEQTAPGTQKHVSIKSDLKGNEGFTEALQWIGPSQDSVILDETRTVAAHLVDGTSGTSPVIRY